jgi:hypothetical protein
MEQSGHYDMFFYICQTFWLDHDLTSAIVDTLGKLVKILRYLQIRQTLVLYFFLNEA